jgi:hypothetical protein
MLFSPVFIATDPRLFTPACPEPRRELRRESRREPRPPFFPFCREGSGPAGKDQTPNPLPHPVRVSLLTPALQQFATGTFKISCL